MAECAINRWAKGKFKGFSAGSHPRGEVHPLALELLNEFNFETAGLRSKSWDEFSRRDSPPLDFVFTVCDQVKGEVPQLLVNDLRRRGLSRKTILNALQSVADSLAAY